MKNLVVNSLYRIIYQLLVIALPIITIPIVSGALGPEGIGEYKYLYSITSYFVLFSGLGLSIYGSRTIAAARDNKKELSKTFWEIEILSVCSTLLFFILYILIGILLKSNIYYYILSISIISALLDITWFYMGIEDFKKITLVNTFVKLLSFIVIVTQVKDQSDLVIYFLVQTISVFLSQASLWIFIHNYISFVKVKFIDCLVHFKGAMKYFFAILATNLYDSITLTLLGIFTTTIFVGYYSNAISIISIVYNLVVTLDWVLLPRMSNIVKKGINKSFIEILNKTIHLQLFISIPIMFGLLSIYKSLIPWFFGKEFLFVNNIFPYLAVLSVIKPLGSAVLNQYLVPVDDTKMYNLSIMVGTIISIALNLLLIPLLGIYGAVISVLLTELSVTVIRVVYLIKKTSFSFNYNLIIKFFICGILMWIVVRSITIDFPSTFRTNVIQIIIGISVYLVSVTVLKANYILNLFKKKLI